MDQVFDFIANTSDGVFVVDRHQTIVLWNEGATAILGFLPDEVIGSKCQDVLQARDIMDCSVCSSDCKLIRAALDHEFYPATDIKTRTRQGIEVWINVSSIAVVAHRHELSGFVHLFREVTHQHELADATRKLADMVSGEASRSSMSPPVDAPVDLTPREREVMRQLTTGASSQTISDRLSISRNTVRNHINNILKKFGVHSRLEAVAYSIRQGLV